MTKEQQFWNWFKANEAKFFFLYKIEDEDERERILDYFLSHLHTYCEHLFFEIGGHPDEKQDLIITAEGDVDYFEQVETLVKQAPYLEHWNVIAFKPAVQGGIVAYNGIQLNPETMYFMPLSNKNSNKIGLRIHVDGYDPAKKEDFLTAAYLTLDNILGEKLCALQIGYVEIQNLPSASEVKELIELEKLPQYIKWKNSRPDA